MNLEGTQRKTVAKMYSHSKDRQSCGETAERSKEGGRWVCTREKHDDDTPHVAHCGDEAVAMWYEDNLAGEKSVDEEEVG